LRKLPESWKRERKTRLRRWEKARQRAAEEEEGSSAPPEKFDPTTLAVAAVCCEKYFEFKPTTRY
jgi:hypothetical protein